MMKKLDEVIRNEVLKIVENKDKLKQTNSDVPFANNFGEKLDISKSKINSLFDLMSCSDFKNKYNGKDKNILKLLEYYHRFNSAGEDSLAASMINAIIKYNTRKPDLAVKILKEQCIQARMRLKSLKKTNIQDSILRGMELVNNQKYEDYIQDNIAEGFSEYSHLSHNEAEELASNNKYNKESYRDRLYGDKKGTIGSSHGYILTPNSFNINRYVRGDSKNISKESKKTISLLNKATVSSKLPKKTRLHRMVNISYLDYCLGIKDYLKISPTKLLSKVNKQTGKVITTRDFMSTGYRVDTIFSGNPVMLTLLCDEGTSIFPTENHLESEIVLPRNTRYVILGAKLYSNNSKTFQLSTHKLGSYKGLEIFVKVIK